VNKKLFQPTSGPLTVQYEPAAANQFIENPPRFTWMAAAPEDDQYILQYSSSEQFEHELTTTVRPLAYNFYTPDHAFAPGTYYWRYALLTHNEAGEWSRVRSFTMPESLPETPLPAKDVRYSKSNAAHPRLWLNQEQIVQFRQAIQQDANAYGWQNFFEHSVQPWIEHELIAEPARYPNNQRVAKLWRKMYMDCQKSLYAVRHLSMAGVILEDQTILARAKEWLIHLCAWDTSGTTSRDYNDEAAFRIAGALAWGYDWLYNELSEDQRAQVRNILLIRTEQVAIHVIERSKIHHVPYDSHSVRSLSSVLVPCCIALLFDEPKVSEWLDYTLEYYACIYSPWGGADGGWAEGPMYWTTGMAYATEAMNLVKKYTAIDFYKRPFFQRTGEFPLYCYSPDTVRASFGDQSTLGDPPSLKTAYLMRQFAGVTGKGEYQWYYEQISRKETVEQADQKFYNYGWWDFRFDEMCYLFDYPTVQAVEPANVEPLKWFKDIDWVAMHHEMTNPDEHIMLLTKSSRYGSMSHSHSDQNSFVLHAYGEPLAMTSGYYIAFGSTMHLNWRRQTISTNSILIDNKGQYGGRDKVKNLEAAGRILEAWHRDRISYVRGDATAAYQHEVPYLKRFEREIYFFDNSYFVIVDHVDLTQVGSVTWQLHTRHEMQLSKQSFKVQGEKADMLGQFIYCSSGEVAMNQSDVFLDVDPTELVGLEGEWYLSAATKSAKSHRLVTLLVPMKKDESRFVSSFIDDQDHGVHIYLTNDGITERVAVNKAY